MKKLKLITIALSLILVLSFALTACRTVVLDKELEIKISVLNGTTGFGIAKLMNDANEKKTDLNYKITVDTDAANIQAGLINGSIDVAALPTNAAAALYNKTEGKIKIAAVNTLGVLYLMTNTHEIEITDIKQLKGQTVYAPAQNPAFIFEAICRANGLIPGKDITIDTAYAQPIDLRAALVSGKVDIAVIPEPMVTTAKMANADLAVGLDLTQEWEKAYGKNSLMQGCIVVRTEWAEAHPKELEQFLSDYEASIKYTTDSPKDASELIVYNGIMAGPSQIVKTAIPKCNIVYMDADDNIAKSLDKFYKTLYEINPQAVGGKVPDSNIYLGK